MTAEVELLPADRIDYGLYAALQKRAFAAHLNQYDVDTGFMNEQYFRWKYSPPAGVGRIAFARLDGEYVAAVATIPLEVGNRAGSVKAWRVMDIATDPRGRGRGLYSTLLERLKDGLPDGEALFAFPNRNSTRGFEKAGGERIDYVPTWMAPVVPLRRRHPAVTDVQRTAGLDEPEWQSLLVHERRTAILRDARYFDWRYRRNPEFSYEMAAYRQDGHLGLIVFRAAEVYGRPVVYVLELWAGTARARSRVLSAAGDYGRRQGALAMLAVGNGMTALQGARHGWLAVPRRFVPKAQIMRAICRDDAARPLICTRWRVEMGDLPEF